MNSIYSATEGEGVFVGFPQIFVRFQGCAIGCLNCDSIDTWSFGEEFSMSLEDVLSKVSDESHHGVIQRVSITGGDPLHPKHHDGLLALIKELKLRRYWINIEAAGTRVPDEIFDQVDFVSIDFKTPSTGVKTPLRNLEKVLLQYEGKFQIKAVVENKNDFDACLSAYEELQGRVDKAVSIPWVMTPCYNLNESFPGERFQKIIEWNQTEGAYFRVIGQQHKWIYGPDQKQV